MTKTPKMIRTSPDSYWDVATAKPLSGLNEISKEMLGRYVKKAGRSVSDMNVSAANSEGSREGTALDAKSYDRQRHIDRATDRLVTGKNEKKRIKRTTGEKDDLRRARETWDE
jgi:hypothetical protein